MRALQDPQKESPPQQQQTQSLAGNLVDAQCRANAPGDKCEVSETTKMFGLETADGKYYKLDGEGNTKVMTALKSSSKRTGAISVAISGVPAGATLKVETIELR